MFYTEKGSPHEQAVEVFAAIHRQALGNPREMGEKEMAEEVASLLISGIDALSALTRICDGRTVRYINKIKSSLPNDYDVQDLMDGLLVCLVDTKEQQHNLENIGKVLAIFAEGVEEQPETSQS